MSAEPLKRKSERSRGSTSSKRTNSYDPLQESSGNNEVSHFLKKILEILSDVKKNKSTSKNYSCVGYNLFLNFYEILRCSDSDSERQIEEVSDTIKQLLCNTFDWLENFLVRFPYIFFTETYSPKTVCELRSGIQFIFDRWGKSISNDKFSEVCNCRLPFIDIILKKWLENSGSWNSDNRKPKIPSDIPAHAWWRWGPTETIEHSVEHSSSSRILRSRRM
jgi:hypothetical protein